MNDEIKSLMEEVTSGKDLSKLQARAVFGQIMQGDLSTSAITDFLVALRQKGECSDEIIGAARAMRANMVRIQCDSDCIDTCGTGGDGISTFNVSTTAAIIAASAGATVAKHGNRSTTRRSGSTEVLTELGIDVDADKSIVERSLAEVRIGYLNARACHPAMRFAAPSRLAIPGRTIFNLLGPLTNPAGAQRQIIGVPQPELLDLVSNAIQQLGARHVWVVHGSGLCDLTVAGSTEVAEVTENSISRHTISPEEVGLERYAIEELTVDSPKQSADAVRDILDGGKGAKRDHALMNSGAALLVAGVTGSLAEGIQKAAEALNSGKARQTLKQWQKIAGTG